MGAAHPKNAGKIGDWQMSKSVIRRLEVQSPKLVKAIREEERERFVKLIEGEKKVQPPSAWGYVLPVLERLTKAIRG